MKNTIYKNTSIVTGLSVAERGLGFLYRIVLSRYIGAEGLGLYQVAHSILFLLMTLCTGGIPVTLSRMLAQNKAEKNERGEKSVLTAGLTLSIFLALPLSILFGLFGGKMSFLFSDPRSFEIFKILLVGLCFSCIYAVIRGYFWGNKQFLTASLLEMSEEIIMVLVGVILLRGVTSPLDGGKKAAYAMMSANIFSCVFAVICLFGSGARLQNPKSALKPLFSGAMPVTAVRASGSLVSSAVAVILPAMLVRAGIGEGEALSLFGVVTGMVMPVLMIPSTLIGSLALVLVPELSADYHSRNEERLKTNVLRGLKFSLLISCALIPLFFVLGEDLGKLAFASAKAGKIIANSCFILLPMSLTMISTSMLNSIGFERQTFTFFFLGAAALLLCILLLPAVCGVYAYILGLGASYLTTAVCNLIFLAKKCSFLFKGRGQVCVHDLFFALIGILPLSILGQLLLAVCKKFLGGFLSIAVTACGLLAATLLFYSLTRLFPLKTLFARRKSK